LTFEKNKWVVVVVPLGHRCSTVFAADNTVLYGFITVVTGLGVVEIETCRYVVVGIINI